MSRYYNDYYGLNSSSLELEHFGILGQRKGARRYQYEDGSLTPLGRIHYGIGAAREAKARWTDSAKSKEYKKDLNDTGGEEYAKKLARTSGLDQGDNWKMYRDALAGDERAQAIVKEWERNKVEAEKKAAEDKARVEAEAKKKAVNSGVASEVMKYAGQMDNNELQYAVNRINLTQQLNAYNQKELDAANKKAFDTLAKVANTTLKIAGGVSQATTYYTNIRKNAPQIQKDFESLKKAVNKKKG